MAKLRQLGELKAYVNSAIGMDGHQMPTQGLEERMIELLDRLEMGNGVGQGRIGRGLELAQEGEYLVADLVAAVEEGGVGGVFDMGKGVDAGIGLDVAA